MRRYSSRPRRHLSMAWCRRRPSESPVMGNANEMGTPFHGMVMAFHHIKSLVGQTFSTADGYYMAVALWTFASGKVSFVMPWFLQARQNWVRWRECCRDIEILGTLDAIPPHLNVLLRLGGSLGVHGSLQFLAFGLLSWFSTLFSIWLYRLGCLVRKRFACGLDFFLFQTMPGFLFLFLCWALFRRPLGLDRTSKTDKNGNEANKDPPTATFVGLFCVLWVTWELDWVFWEAKEVASQTPWRIRSGHRNNCFTGFMNTHR